jgi:alpha-L-arabinofuranosidase
LKTAPDTSIELPTQDTQELLSAHLPAPKPPSCRRVVLHHASRVSLLLVQLFLCGCLAVDYSTASAPAEHRSGLPSKIEVHPKQSLGKISPLIFGAAVEWTENGNLIFDPASGRIRPDVVNALKPIKISVVRFPGGILADHYHWRDAIGSRQSRPSRTNPMDNSEHANNFGTDEFISFCRQINAEPLITANAGTGSLDEALGWQKYFHDQNFPVKYWEIGNEIYLAEPKQRASIPGNDNRIYKNPGQYAQLFNTWSDALRKQPDTPVVGAIAGTYNTSQQNKGWLDNLLSTSSSKIDFISLHDSFAPLIFSSYNYSDANKRTDAYRAMFAAVDYVGADIDSVQAKLHQSGARSDRIAITEHFPIFGAGSHEQLLASLDQSRTLGSALYTASLLQTFMRKRVWMANYNLITSKWFGALLTLSDTGVVRTPTYYVWDLYRNRFGDELVGVDVVTDTFDTKRIGAIASKKGVPYLDVAASRDSQNSIYLSVINRDMANPIAAAITVDGLAAGMHVSVLTLNGNSETSINGSGLTRTTQGGSPDNVTPKATQWISSDQPYSFPAHSITVMKWNPIPQPPPRKR